MIEPDFTRGGDGTPRGGGSRPVSEHQVPEEWRVVPLGSVADVRASSVNKKSVASEAPVRLCNYVDVYANHHITPALPFMEATATAAEIEKFGLQDGDVIITKDSETPDDIAVPAVVEDLGGLLLVCGYHLTLLRPTSAIEGRYLARCLSLPSVNAHFRRLAQGTTRYGLTIQTVASAPIAQPPLPEQRRIAGILDTVDQAIRHTEAIIAKLEQMKAGLLRDLLTLGLDENGELRTQDRPPEQFKDSPLGRIPREWEICRLGDLCALLNGLAFKPAEWSEKGLPIIRIQNLNGSRDFNHFDGEVAEKYLIPPGELLFSWSGSRGTSFGPYLWNGPRGILNQHIFRVLPTDIVDKQWLYFALDEVRERVERNAHGASGLVHVRKGDLLDYPVPTPGLAEQARVVETMRAHNARIASERSEQDKLTAIKVGLSQDLLTGRVRVREPVAATA